MAQKNRKRSNDHVKAQLEGKQLDNYRCFLCGKRSFKNEGHHIIPYKDGGKATVKNIITLCPKCHHDLHAGRISGKLLGF